MKGTPVERMLWAIAVAVLLVALFAAVKAYGCSSMNGKVSICQEVPSLSTEFVWTSLFQQTNHADTGENVVLYSQQLKQGTGTSWASVFEARCYNRRGGCHGQEIDLVVDGPLQLGDWRIGQSIVIWKMPGSDGVPSANFGLLVAPQWTERENVKVDVGIGIQTRNNVAALQVRSGEKIALDDSGRIAFRFNPATKQIEFLNGETVLWAVPVN